MLRRRMTRTESQAQTRADLLEATARVFKRRGYERASIAEIADEAGYSHGAVYSNFDGKDDLFLALYEQWVARRVAEIDATWSQEGTLAERARAAADEWMRRLSSEPAPFLLRLELTARAAHDRDLQEKLATRAGAVPLAIRRLIESAANEKALARRLPPDELALGFQALSLGLALEALTGPAAVRPGLGGELAAFLAEALQNRSGSETA
jgi:AcrR family transcriptional regulator